MREIGINSTFIIEKEVETVTGVNIEKEVEKEKEVEIVKKNIETKEILTVKDLANVLIVEIGQVETNIESTKEKGRASTTSELQELSSHCHFICGLESDKKYPITVINTVSFLDNFFKSLDNRNKITVIR